MTGPRVYVRGRRVHHGLTGALLALVGGLLMLHDRRDFPWRTTDPTIRPRRRTR